MEPINLLIKRLEFGSKGQNQKVNISALKIKLKINTLKYLENIEYRYHDMAVSCGNLKIISV